MPPIPIIRVDLDRSPEERWVGFAAHRAAVRALCQAYTQDLGDYASFLPALAMYRDMCVPREHVREIQAVAELVGLPEPEVLLANLYYDALKHVLGGSFGCTGLAVETDDGPLHARNLDWHSPDDVLRRHAALVELRRGGDVVARMVGWPGLVGCYSGVAPGRFAASLNAVLSAEAPGLHLPMLLLLRQVLESAGSFDEAVTRLATEPVASDSLLLVTGPEPGQRVVIERTPTRHAIRRASGPLVVTNDYRVLGDTRASGELGATACERHDRALARGAGVRSAADAFRVLSDPRVRMGITVQQMVFRARTGEVWFAGERIA